MKRPTEPYNRPRSIYQYSNMATRLPGQTSLFGVIFFVFKSLLGIERQKKLRKFTFFTRKPRSHVRILIYRTSPIVNLFDKFKSGLIFISNCIRYFVKCRANQSRDYSACYHWLTVNNICLLIVHMSVTSLPTRISF